MHTKKSLCHTNIIVDHLNPLPPHPSHHHHPTQKLRECYSGRVYSYSIRRIFWICMISCMKKKICMEWQSRWLGGYLRVAMGGSLHDARLGFFGLSRARHGVHGLHGSRRTSVSIRTHKKKLCKVSDWEFRSNTKDIWMKITKPWECEKKKCSRGLCSQWKCFVIFSISGGKLTNITELRECE